MLLLRDRTLQSSPPLSLTKLLTTPLRRKPFHHLLFLSAHQSTHHTKPQRQQQQHSLPGKPRPSPTSAAENRWVPLIESCSSKSHLRQLHAHIIRSVAGKNPAVMATFLSRVALRPLGDMEYSRRVFKQIARPNASHYNAMIRGYSQSNSPEKAFCLMRDMLGRGLSADPVCSSFVVKACTRLAYLFGGRQVHGGTVRNGYQSDSRLLTSLMDLYASCGTTVDAEHVFDEMAVRDVVAWNVLISCYARNGRSKDALVLFDLMQEPRYGLEPDEVTCLLLLQACARLGAVECGERIHSFIEEHGYGGALNLRNSLVAMYSKCGSVDTAFKIFNETTNKNVVTWSAIISGLAMNGHGWDALEAFSEMQRAGVTPDEQTFTGVLSACSHCGLVDQGLWFFDSMKTEYGLVPNLHHYGCMVDLLGRAGLLDQAYGLIVKAETIKPDAAIWRTLLGACRIHRYVELGERVVTHLVELKAQEAGDYILLLNIYSSVGNWEKVTEVRRLMKDSGIQTTPGCSTIEIRGKVHEFVVDDDTHPRKAEIYLTLDEIGKQLKIAGYVANVEAEMHNTDVEAKETALSYHSEKLAIAFGILSTPPGERLRIAKNLRTCVDCHTFAKMVSTVYNRKLVIRDRSRFHHFREGYCSCNDYW
ncbi:hypothetical protein Taro_048360 [Colocasia esculenta]|uniref:DYW domain-containing protein n=1 Tax=Colocasia esculenta TaxID=4460 RepID=A0A843WVL5_COLES|nr:hypothetical protein [Colocasia esculenta]